MAVPERFHFDSEQRSVGAAGARRRTWLWVAVSLALHGALILFVLAGAARGGHTELAGVLEVAVVGPLSAGDPESRARDGDAKASPPDESARRPEAPPEAPSAPPPPRGADEARATDAGPSAPTPPQAQDMPRPPSAESPDALATPRRPDQAVAAPTEPQPPKTESAPARPPTAEAATPPAPPKETAPQIPPRPKAARELTAKPSLAAPPRQGRRDAPPGQTASLGSPSGGERLGRSDTDETGGLIKVNLNPRFRVPPPPPHYPRLSVERDEEGVVLVRALVDHTGAPQRVTVWKSSGYALLDEAALKAVQGWRFEPMVREGRATVSWVQVPVRFRLN